LIPQLRAGVAAGAAQETGQLPALARAATRPDGRAERAEMQVVLVRADAVQSAAQTAAGSGGVPLDAAALAGGALQTGASHRNTSTPAALNRFAPAERRYVADYFRRQADAADAARVGDGSP
jgi:hypothetical protein